MNLVLCGKWTDWKHEIWSSLQTLPWFSSTRSLLVTYQPVFWLMVRISRDQLLITPPQVYVQCHFQHSSWEFPTWVIRFDQSHPYSLTHSLSVIPQLLSPPNLMRFGILSHWIHLMYEFRLNYWSLGSLSDNAFQKKTDCPSHTSYQLPITPQLRVDFRVPLTFLLRYCLAWTSTSLSLVINVPCSYVLL